MCAGPPGRAVTTVVKVLAASTAHDETLVDQLVDLVNRAYDIGEAGLWLGGATRIGPSEIRDAIRSGGMLAATADGQLAGCVYLQRLDPGTADLGLLSVAPGHWGHGVGRELVRAAEQQMRSDGVTTMQLELLVPKGWVHPEKARLRAWYTRLGYKVIRSEPFEHIAPAHRASQLRTPCEFLIFCKPL
jgi:GNAT superfamily N-acetyltransferase